MRAILLALSAVFVVALAACQSEEEVDLVNPDSPAGLTAEELLDRVRVAGRSVESFRMIETGVSEEDGERTEHEEETILVGEDEYTRNTAGVGPLGLTEELTYGGKHYGRDGSGRWRPMQELLSEGNVVTWEIGIGPTGAAPPEPLSNVYWYSLMLEGLSGVKRLGDESVDGRSFLRVVGAQSMPIGLPDVDEMMRQMIPEGAVVDGLPQDLRDRVSAEFSKMPEGVTASLDLWIDPDDFLVYRLQVSTSATRGGKTVSSSERTTDYSEFNTAELPEPLPDD